MIQLDLSYVAGWDLQGSVILGRLMRQVVGGEETKRTVQVVKE